MNNKKKSNMFLFVICILISINVFIYLNIKENIDNKELPLDNTNSLNDYSTNFSVVDDSQEQPIAGEHICLVNINNTVYHTFFKRSDIVDAPTKNEILGTILKLTLGESPDEHEETNFPECLNQEYAYIDGKLILHILYPIGTEGNWYLMHTAEN